MQIRCLIVDDNESFLEAARTFLERDGLSVVGVARTADEAVEQVHTVRPNVILVDISLGDENGFDVVRGLVEDGAGGDASIILISTRSEEEVAGLIAASPAAGFLSKEDLSASAIRRVVEASTGPVER